MNSRAESTIFTGWRENFPGNGAPYNYPAVVKSRWRPVGGFFRVPENLFRTPWPPPWNVITGWIMWAVLERVISNESPREEDGCWESMWLHWRESLHRWQGPYVCQYPGKTLQQSNLPFSFIINRPRPGFINIIVHLDWSGTVTFTLRAYGVCWTIKEERSAFIFFHPRVFVVRGIFRKAS